MPIVQNSKRIPWARIFAEGVLIVVSILLAFAIDAAWDRHQEREVTRRHLQALVSEIREIQDDLRGEIKGTESSRAGSRTVLKFMTRRTGNLTQKELWDALDKSFDVGIFSSESPVLTMMLASGELMDLGSDSLVPILTLWQGELEHLRLDSQHLERNREEVIFGRSVDLGIPLSPDHLSPSLSLLLDDDGMKAAFVLRLARSDRLVASYQSAVQLGDEVVQMLDSALATSFD